jgi:hypothetical protein
LCSFNALPELDPEAVPELAFVLSESAPEASSSPAMVFTRDASVGVLGSFASVTDDIAFESGEGDSCASSSRALSTG